MRKALVFVIVPALASVAIAARTVDVTKLQQLIDQLASRTTSMQTTTAPVVRVPAGGNLQAAIDAARPGTTILVAPATFTGNFVLRNKGVAANIVIRTDGLDDTALPPNVRVNGPATSSRMAKLVPMDTLSAIITTENGADGYTLVGLELPGNAKHPDRDLAIFGSLDLTAVGQLPKNIVVDRAYIHGDSAGGGHRGVLMDAVNGAVINSDIRNFWEIGRDSQAVLVANTNGPTRVENNYLEATGENFLTGGVDPKIPNALPSDLVFRGNYVAKPAEWQTSKKGSVKNSFELKLCQRCLIENNVFEGNWPDAQAGYGIQFTVRNNDGTAPWSTVQNVTFQYNVVKAIQGACINMLGNDDREGVVDVWGTNMVIQHNVFECTDGLVVNRGFRPTVIRHNTFVLPMPSHWFLQLTAAAMPSGMLTFQDNVVATGQWGIVGDGTGVGLPSVTAFAPGATFDHNVIEQPNSYPIPLPAGNTVLGGGVLARRLDAKKRYTGTELGHDGVKVGADIDGLISRIPWASW
jgi:hypothetical protein